MTLIYARTMLKISVGCGHRVSSKYKITFVSSQLETTNSKGGFVLKTRFETFGFKISVKDICILLFLSTKYILFQRLLLKYPYSLLLNIC